MIVPIDVNILKVNKIFQPPVGWDAVIVNVLAAAGDLVQINVSDVEANVLCLFMMEKMNIKLVNALQNVPKDSFKLKVGSKKGILY